jgi:hypothetical protein
VEQQTQEEREVEKAWGGEEREKEEEAREVAGTAQTHASQKGRTFAQTWVQT